MRQSRESWYLKPLKTPTQNAPNPIFVAPPGTGQPVSHTPEAAPASQTIEAPTPQAPVAPEAVSTEAVSAPQAARPNLPNTPPNTPRNAQIANNSPLQDRRGEVKQTTESDEYQAKLGMALRQARYEYVTNSDAARDSAGLDHDASARQTFEDIIIQQRQIMAMALNLMESWTHIHDFTPETANIHILLGSPQSRYSFVKGAWVADSQSGSHVRAWFDRNANDVHDAGDAYHYLYKIDHIIGGSGADTLIGNANANRLTGKGGDDQLEGGAGDDQLLGGAGNDILRGDIGNDLLRGGPGADNLTLGGGNDIAFGDKGDDIINGDAVGIDQIDGGAGRDSLRIHAAFDISVNMADPQKYQRVKGSDNAVWQADNEGSYFRLWGDIDGNGIAGSNDGFTYLRNIENIITGSGNDTLTGDAQNNRLLAGQGNDTLNGGAGDDELTGGRGLDVLNGGAGTDSALWPSTWINGQEAKLTINLAETTKYKLVQGIWQAHETGEYSRAWLDSNHNNTLDANDEFDYLRDIEGLVGGGGDDHLTGNAADNILYGQEGNDTLTGHDGDDWLNGGGGYDRLIGGAGNDVLDGFSRRDTMTGGAGDDIFLLWLTPAWRADDRVTDFAKGDKIRIELDSKPTTLAELKQSAKLDFSNDGTHTSLTFLGADNAPGGIGSNADMVVMVLENYTDTLVFTDFDII